MKKWLAIAATTTLLSSGFAAETYDQEIAFSSGHRMENGESKERAKFFFGYKLFLTQPGNNEQKTVDSRGLWGILTSPGTYAFGETSETNTGSSVSKSEFINDNYDWNIGHFGVIGVQLPNTMLKIFAEGLFFNNSKRRTLAAPDVTGDASFVSGPVFFDSNEEEPLSYSGTKLASKVKNNLYMTNLFVSCPAYRKGSFFLIPYVGPKYVQNKRNIHAEFSGSVEDQTAKLTANQKHEGFGVAVALMAKYFFNDKFYAFGDYRYTMLFKRSRFIGSDFVEIPASGENPAEITKISSRNVMAGSDQMFELTCGAGLLAFDHSNWNLSFDACYKIISWGSVDQSYQGLGLGMNLGF